MVVHSQNTVAEMPQSILKHYSNEPNSSILNGTHISQNAVHFIYLQMYTYSLHVVKKIHSMTLLQLTLKCFLTSKCITLQP